MGIFQDYNMTLDYFIQEGRWSSEMLDRFIGKELVNLITKVQIYSEGMEDFMELKWKLAGKSLSGLIKEKAAKEETEAISWSWIHKINLNAKVGLFVWRLCKGALPTADHLVKRRLAA